MAIRFWLDGSILPVSYLAMALVEICPSNSEQSSLWESPRILRAFISRCAKTCSIIQHYSSSMIFLVCKITKNIPICTPFSIFFLVFFLHPYQILDIDSWNPGNSTHGRAFPPTNSNRTCVLSLHWNSLLHRYWLPAWKPCRWGKENGSIWGSCRNRDECLKTAWFRMRITTSHKSTNLPTFPQTTP